MCVINAIESSEDPFWLPMYKHSDTSYCGNDLDNNFLKSKIKIATIRLDFDKYMSYSKYYIGSNHNFVYANLESYRDGKNDTGCDFH